MPVKDLVMQFESPSLGSEESRPLSPPGRYSAMPSTSIGPSPFPARFVQHPLLKRQSIPVPTTTPFRPRRKPPHRTTDGRDDQEDTRSPGNPGLPGKSTPAGDTSERGPSSMLSFLGNSNLPSPNAYTEQKIMQGESRTKITHAPATPVSSKAIGYVPRATEDTMTVVEKNRAFPTRSITKPLAPDQNVEGLPISPTVRDASGEVQPRNGGPNAGTSQQSDIRPMGINSIANGQPNIHQNPPEYSVLQRDSQMKRSSYTSIQGRLSRTFNDFPLDTFSRPSHDHDDSMTSRPPSPSATLISQSVTTPHVPIAAKTVFSRGSAPLSLPALDDYLSSFPAPAFSYFPSNNRTTPNVKQSNTNLFPPMDLLAATGLTLDDLEKNSTIPSWWRNRGTIFGSVVNIMIGITGSSALAMYYSLQGLYDGFQIFALLLSTIVPNSGQDISDKWRNLFLGTIPNVLALNLSYTLVESFILLIVLMSCSGLLLYYFHVSTTRIALASTREGLQGQDTSSSWGIIFASFVLTLIYLPLSTITVHALLWSQDFWVIPNPYLNATSLPPSLPPLGPSSEFRDPLDFCYTTTMNKNEINFAPAVVALAALTFVFLTLWFPIRLAMVIRGAVPRVDRYTELGRRRGQVELDHEYERLLHRDKNPFNFLYKGYRMGWGTYESSYLFVKLSALLIVAFIDPNNCVLRNSNRNTVSIVRQAVLLFAMALFLLLQSILTPFLDPVNNASEWISRVGYVAFATLGLTAALNIPASVKNALNGPILYIVYIINYGFTFYFLIINLSWTHRLVKKLSRRIDFSIDIFSPHLDISKMSRHTRRRIWQESISVLLLASHECAIPKSQKMLFSESADSLWPPYLLDFQGTPAERHVENLKILREVGGLEYAKGVALHSGRHAERIRYIQGKIQRHFIGPDSYWNTPSRCGALSGCFGNAWWIPFPPTLVIRYDSGEHAVLNKLHELEEYVYQNESATVQEKKYIRMSLRALDGLVVAWPYTHIQPIGRRSLWCWGRRYSAQASTRYESCVLSIGRRGSLPWKGIQLGSGFNVQLGYAPDVKIDGTAIGLDDEFDLTPQLARFLALNKELIRDRMSRIDSVVRDYRRSTRRNARAKCDALTYEFLSNVYCTPKELHHLMKTVAEQEKDLRVRQTFVEHEDALAAANERMAFVNKTEASTWWYLYWDDLWRRNYDTITALKTHESDFNPHYPSSIAYRLLPRAALETFLAQRGLYFKNGGWTDFIHAGILNKLYFRLNQIIFRGSDKAIAYHLGDDSFAVDLEDSGFLSHAKSSSLGTGGGTDHDDVSIRARPLYRWEAIFEDPLQHGNGRYRRWLPKLSVWLGLTPFWKHRTALTSGVSLDVRLEDGRYVLLENAVDELKDKVV